MCFAFCDGTTIACRRNARQRFSSADPLRQASAGEDVPRLVNVVPKNPNEKRHAISWQNNWGQTNERIGNLGRWGTQNAILSLVGLTK